MRRNAYFGTLERGEVMPELYDPSPMRIVVRFADPGASSLERYCS